MRTYLSLSIMSLMALCSLSVAKGNEHKHWSYQGNESPMHWGNIDESFKLCKIGKNQSPVDLSKSIATSRSNLLLDNSLMDEYKIENNGHTIQATPIKNTIKTTIDDQPFFLKQFHFHTPSEHTFKHKHYPIEAHFVHQSIEGELAVLAVMFKEGKENPAFEPLINQRLSINESIKKTFSPQSLLPKKQEFFRLNGSLTTPPCSEGVNWIVFKYPVELSKKQIESMKQMIGQENNRPLQPINSRIIIEQGN